MNLTDMQKRMVAEWIQQGLKPGEIQKRLDSELGVRLTYMELRFILGDLQLMPKDKETPRATEPAPVPPPEAEPEEAEADAEAEQFEESAPEEPPPQRAGVSLTVDQLARPGTLVSGSVTFSDGNKGIWYVDQTGRMGVVTENRGYRPPAGDVQEFQAAIERELAKLGFC